MLTTQHAVPRLLGSFLPLHSRSLLTVHSSPEPASSDFRLMLLHTLLVRTPIPYAHTHTQACSSLISQLADLQAPLAVSASEFLFFPCLISSSLPFAGGHSPLLIFVASLINQSIRRPRELVSTVNDLDRSSDVPLSEDDHDGMTFSYAGGTSSLYTRTST